MRNQYASSSFRLQFITILLSIIPLFVRRILHGDFVIVRSRIVLGKEKDLCPCSPLFFCAGLRRRKYQFNTSLMLQPQNGSMRIKFDSEGFFYYFRLINEIELYEPTRLIDFSPWSCGKNFLKEIEWGQKEIAMFNNKLRLNRITQVKSHCGSSLISAANEAHCKCATTGIRQTKKKFFVREMICGHTWSIIFCKGAPKEKRTSNCDEEQWQRRAKGEKAKKTLLNGMKICFEVATPNPG